jgi:hypothetical protein
MVNPPPSDHGPPLVAAVDFARAPNGCSHHPRPLLGSARGELECCLGWLGGGAGAASAGIAARCDATKEGHGVTGVCDRDRWLLQAQGVVPGHVLRLPRPAHAPEGDHLRIFVLLISPAVKGLRAEASCDGTVVPIRRAGPVPAPPCRCTGRLVRRIRLHERSGAHVPIEPRKWAAARVTNAPRKLERTVDDPVGALDILVRVMKVWQGYGPRRVGDLF